MKYLANIVTKGKIDVSTFFNVTSDFNNITPNIPTLIVGWKETKTLFPEQNILYSEINEYVEWTFSKREKRYKYEIDVERFVSKIASGIDKQVNYRFFNYILATQEKREKFINHVNKGNCSIYYNSRFIYVYDGNSYMTIGISIRDLLYIGINIKQFIKQMNHNQNNMLVDTLNFIDNQSFSFIKDNIKAAAYLYYLKNSNIY